MSDLMNSPKRIRLIEDRSEMRTSLNCKLHLTDAYEKFYLDETTSDVTLIIEDTEVPVHRIILAADSEFFMRLFYGDFAEKDQKEIVMPDISLESFKICMQYMYFKEIEIDEWYEEIEVLLTALEHANRFGLEGLKKGIGKYLRKIMEGFNVLSILKMAKLVGLQKLMDHALSFASYRESVFTGEEFLTLDLSTFLLLLENFNAGYNFKREIARFTGIRDWLHRNAALVTTEQRENILSYVKLEYMTQKELTEVVRPSNLFNDSSIQAALQLTGFAVRQVSNCRNPEYFQATNTYVASAKEMIVDGLETYGIIVELETENIINYMEFNLPELYNYDKNGYKIDIAIHQDVWTNVIDYSKYPCKGFQTLYFSTPLKVRFVRIHSIAFRLECNGFKVEYTAKSVKLMETFLCPSNLMSINGSIKTYIDYRDDQSEDDYYENQDESFTIKDYLITFNDAQKVRQFWSTSKTSSDAKISFNQPYYLNVIEFKRPWMEQLKVTIITNDASKRVVHDCNGKDDSWHKITFPAMAIVGVTIEGTREPIKIEQLNVYYDQDI